MIDTTTARLRELATLIAHREAALQAFISEGLGDSEEAAELRGNLALLRAEEETLHAAKLDARKRSLAGKLGPSFSYERAVIEAWREGARFLYRLSDDHVKASRPRPDGTWQYGLIRNQGGRTGSWSPGRTPRWSPTLTPPAAGRRLDLTTTENTDMTDWSQHTIYRCLVGSRAYGLASETSDTDTRGVFLPPARAHWSLTGVPEQTEDRATDTAFWEIGKFLRLALKANPIILETLWSPIVLQTTPLGDELRGMRQAFLSRRLYRTYRGYAHEQFRELERTRQDDAGPRWKQAMHTLRLLLAGASALRSGDVLVDMSMYRDDLLAIRAGRWSWDDVLAWRAELESAIDNAFAQTALPDEPDVRVVDAFLIRAREAAYATDAAQDVSVTLPIV